MGSGAIGLTVLLDDTVNAMGLQAEHGLSFLLEKGDDVVLFDAGQTGLFLRNATKLGKDLSRAKAIVLSHGHYDHTGGLLKALRAAGSATVYAHPDVFLRRYAIRKSGEAVPAGIRFRRKRIEATGRIVLSDRPMEIVPGVRTTGQVPRLTDFEDTGGPFFLDAGGAKKDDLLDDLALFFEGRQGTVVVAGCAHSGVVNILHRVAELTGRRRIHAVIGGMHLGAASEERIKRTCQAFRDFGVEKIGLAHCTGIRATVRFLNEFRGGCFLCPTGACISL